MRASRGAFFGQTFIRTSPAQLHQWVQQHNLPVVGASPDGTLVYNEFRYERPMVLVLGEERSGLSQEQRQLCQQLVRIPMVGGTDSLNLGVAGSLLLYEIMRSALPP